MRPIRPSLAPLRTLSLAALLALPAAPGAADERAPGMVALRDSFLIALEAATACGTVDPEAVGRWGDNFVLVMRGAARELARAGGGRTPDELMAADRARMEAVEREAQGVVRSLGCDHPAVRSLLDLHRYHETLEVAEGEPA